MVDLVVEGKEGELGIYEVINGELSLVDRIMFAPVKDGDAGSKAVEVYRALNGGEGPVIVRYTDDIAKLTEDSDWYRREFLRLEL